MRVLLWIGAAVAAVAWLGWLWVRVTVWAFLVRYFGA